MQPEEMVGHVLGHYRILRTLGYGGTSTVFLAEDINLKREVAVKVFQPREGETQDFMRRFSREARVLAQLDHPNILPIYDYGEQNNTAYLVIPYMPGGSLRDRLRKSSTVPPQEAVRLMGQILNALQYAHDRGLIHRDIKPGNMLFKADGTLMLSDFGLVKVLTPDTDATQIGDGMSMTGHAIAGTPDYMAPEQIVGQVSPASDIYGVGVALYEMLTGSRLFNADNYMGMLMKHLHEQPRPLRQLNPTISPALEAVVMRALDKEPTRRYQRPLDFLYALQNALDQNGPTATGIEATMATNWATEPMAATGMGNVPSSPSSPPPSHPSRPSNPSHPPLPQQSNTGQGVQGSFVLRSEQPQPSIPYTPSGATQFANKNAGYAGYPVTPPPAQQKKRSPLALIVTLGLVVVLLLVSLGIVFANPGLIGLRRGADQTATTIAQTTRTGGTVTKGGATSVPGGQVPTVTTVTMGQTTTTCPATGTARAAVTAPLALGNHQNLVYIVNEGTFDNPTFGTLKRRDVTANLSGNSITGIEISKMANTYISEAQISQDGQWILFTAKVSGQYQLRMVRVDGQGLQTLYCAQNSPIFNTQWSFDQKHAIFDVGSSAPTAMLLDMSSGNILSIVLPDTNGNRSYVARTWLDNSHVYMVGIVPNSDAPPQDIYLLDVQKGANQHGSDLTKVASAPNGCTSFDTSYDSTQLYVATCSNGATVASGPGAATGPSTLTVQGAAAGSTPKTIYTSQTQALTLIRSISPTTLLGVIATSGDTSQNGLWKLNADGSNPVRLTTDPNSNDTLCPYTQYAWSNVSRDGSLYALQSFDGKANRYGMSYGSLSGGNPTKFADISDGTQLFLVGWTSM